MKKTADIKPKMAFVLVIFLLLIAVGIILGILSGDNRLNGLGWGLAGASFSLGIVYIVSINRKPSDARRDKINENDERSIKIREKSAYGTFYVTMIGLSVVELVLGYLGYMIPCYIIMGLMAIHIISYFVLLYHNSKKY